MFIWKNVIGLTSHNSIDNAIKGKIQKTAYGYKWSQINNVIIDVE